MVHRNDGWSRIAIILLLAALILVGDCGCNLLEMIINDLNHQCRGAPLNVSQSQHLVPCSCCMVLDNQGEYAAHLVARLDGFRCVQIITVLLVNPS